jgi:hypothetical protein
VLLDARSSRPPPADRRRMTELGALVPGPCRAPRLRALHERAACAPAGRGLGGGRRAGARGAGRRLAARRRCSNAGPRWRRRWAGRAASGSRAAPCSAGWPLRAWRWLEAERGRRRLGRLRRPVVVDDHRRGGRRSAGAAVDCRAARGWRPPPAWRSGSRCAEPTFFARACPALVYVYRAIRN